MSNGVPYVGRAPDSDSAVTNKQYVDTRYGQLAIDLSYVNATAASAAAALVTNSYVDTQDALRAKISAVNTADANYVPLTQRGAANGVATLDGSGNVTASQLPTLVTDRVVKYANVTTTFLTTRTVVTTLTKEYLAATISITDPGYAYFPLVFGSVWGQCGSSQGAVRRAGNGSIGKMVVLDASDNVWAGGVTAGSYQAAQYEIQPVSSPNDTPFNAGPVFGSMTLNLYLSLWSGASYNFDGTDLVFYAILWPGA